MTKSLQEINVRSDIRPGDLGYVIHRHGYLYGIEYGYGAAFEVYVASGLAEFYERHDPDKDRVWIAESAGATIGFLLLMHREHNTAQLRYFLVEPAYRGIGLGNRLMSLYMEFFRAAGYARSYLWTTHELTAAAALYRRHGFKLMEEKESAAFGKRVKEQRYDFVSPACP